MGPPRKTGPFTAPKVKEFFEGLTREEACRIVSEPAQSEAVAAAERSQRAEIALDRLTGLVEARLVEKRKQGELIARAEVDRMRVEHEQDKALIAESATEKDARIQALERQLAERETALKAAHRHARWSPSYRLAQLQGWLASARRWARERLWRLLIVAGGLALAISVQVGGWGGTVLPIIGWAGFAITLLAADPTVVKKNIGSVFRRRQ
jgi:hypothetical protein